MKAWRHRYEELEPRSESASPDSTGKIDACGAVDTSFCYY